MKDNQTVKLSAVAKSNKTESPILFERFLRVSKFHLEKMLSK